MSVCLNEGMEEDEESSNGTPVLFLSSLGDSCSNVPPASFSPEVNRLPQEARVRAGHLLSLDKIQEGAVSLNVHPSFVRAPQAH